MALCFGCPGHKAPKIFEFHHFLRPCIIFYMIVNFMLLSPKSCLTHTALISCQHYFLFKFRYLLIVSRHDVICDIILDLEESDRYCPPQKKNLFVS